MQPWGPEGGHREQQSSRSCGGHAQGKTAPISINPPCRDTQEGGNHHEIQTWGGISAVENLSDLEEEQMPASCWESLASGNAAGEREPPLSNTNQQVGEIWMHRRETSHHSACP